MKTPKRAMKPWIAPFLLVLVATTALAAAEPGAKVPAFTAKATVLTGSEPVTTDLDSQKTTKPTVYFVLGTQCGTSAAYVERLRELEAAYSKQGVDFVYVYPNRTDTSEAKTAFHKEKQLAGALVDDQGAVVAKALGAQRTAEAFVVMKDGTLVYSGAVDDNKDVGSVKNRYVATALDESLAGKPVTTKSAPVSA